MGWSVEKLAWKKRNPPTWWQRTSIFPTKEVDNWLIFARCERISMSYSWLILVVVVESSLLFHSIPFPSVPFELVYPIQSIELNSIPFHRIQLQPIQSTERHSPRRDATRPLGSLQQLRLSDWIIDQYTVKPALQPSELNWSCRAPNQSRMFRQQLHQMSPLLKSTTTTICKRMRRRFREYQDSSIRFTRSTLGKQIDEAD